MTKEKKITSVLSGLNNGCPENMKLLRGGVVLVENGESEQDWNVRRRMRLWREARSHSYLSRSEARALIQVQQLIFTSNI